MGGRAIFSLKKYLFHLECYHDQFLFFFSFNGKQVYFCSKMVDVNIARFLFLSFLLCTQVSKSSSFLHTYIMVAFLLEASLALTCKNQTIQMQHANVKKYTNTAQSSNGQKKN